MQHVQCCRKLNNESEIDKYCLCMICEYFCGFTQKINRYLISVSKLRSARKGGCYFLVNHSNILHIKLNVSYLYSIYY